MNIKKFCAALVVSTTLLSTAFAAGADDELSIMAAEQRRDSPSDTETFEQPEEPQPIKQPAVERPTVEHPVVNQPKVETPKVETRPAVSQSTVETKNEQPAVGMPNPIVSYNTFDEMVEELGYVPLYVPKSSGYIINYMSIIGEKVADLRFNRRWETEVKLSVRTYKRADGEELKDISGVNGVKWRVDLSGGIPIYLARINENSNAAAWSVGNYTFAATTENLSFAAFRTLVFEELADLSEHYFIDID